MKRLPFGPAGLFDLLGVPVLAGRAFHSGDFGADGARRGVIVNQSFVRHLMGDKNPIGRRVRYANALRNEPPGAWFEIVGVVPDFGVNRLDLKDAARLYHPVAAGSLNPVNVIVRVVGNPESFAPRLRALAAAVEPTMWVDDVLPYEDALRGHRAAKKLIVSVLALLTLMTLLLSAGATYALMSFTVSQRTREIGIRTALGAYPRRIVAAILSRALAQLGAGIVVGWMLGAVVLNATTDEKVLGGLEVFVAMSVVVLVVGLFACAPPARRVLRIQPTDALREG